MDARTHCLGVLSLGPATGYEIRKFTEKGPFASFHPISFGSIYPALASLLSDGFVTCQEEAQASKPDKKVYEITEKGRDFFQRALHYSPDRERYRSDALFMLFFAEKVDPLHTEIVLNSYHDERALVVERIEEAEETDMIGRNFMRGLGLAMNKAALAYINEHKDAFLAQIKEI